MLTHNELIKILSYCSETGKFTWINPPSPSKVKVGDVAGTMMSDGYRSITINSKMHKEHRLAWLYMTGEWPSKKMDHINRNRGDNRWANLRLATYSENTANRTGHNRYGFKGVSTNSRCVTKPYRAQIEVRENGRRKSISLGTFKTALEAHEAYMTALKVRHPEHAAP